MGRMQPPTSPSPTWFRPDPPESRPKTTRSCSKLAQRWTVAAQVSQNPSTTLAEPSHKFGRSCSGSAEAKANVVEPPSNLVDRAPDFVAPIRTWPNAAHVWSTPTTVVSELLSTFGPPLGGLHAFEAWPGLGTPSPIWALPTMLPKLLTIWGYPLGVWPKPLKCWSIPLGVWQDLCRVGHTHPKCCRDLLLKLPEPCPHEADHRPRARRAQPTTGDLSATSNREGAIYAGSKR